MQFPDYFNTATFMCGFDVDTVSGIVAASQVSQFLEAHTPFAGPCNEL